MSVLHQTKKKVNLFGRHLKWTWQKPMIDLVGLSWRSFFEEWVFLIKFFVSPTLLSLSCLMDIFLLISRLREVSNKVISPYLFILYMNVLSCFLLEAEKANNFNGIQFASRGPRISHLMYADVLVIFFKALKQSATFLKSAPNQFCDLVGFSINVQKPNHVLSPNSPTSLKRSISFVLGVPLYIKLERYLGVFVDDKHD